MIPKYEVGSLIYVTSTTFEDVKVGDAITFYMKNSKIVATHEVYEIDSENKLLYTQGINNFDSDGNIMHDVNPVSQDRLIGKPILNIPYLGYVNKFITKKPTLYIIITITIIMIFVSYLLYEKKEELK